MKKTFVYQILFISAMCTLFACEDFDVEDPVAAFNILRLTENEEFEMASTFSVGEDVYIENAGTGERFTVFTGDKGHDGSTKTYVDDKGVEKINTGFNLNHTREDAKFKYAYTTPGTYQIKVIAISNMDLGSDIEQDVATAEITIIE